MKKSKLISYFSIMEKDERLTAWHVAIFIAILIIALQQGRAEAIKVSRRKIMALSHITALPTYHKYLKELQQLGYLTYRPSYHPGVRSEIDIKKQP
jgi:hypothetical protein